MRSFDRTVRASITVNRWLGLNETPDAVFALSEVYPAEGRPLGAYRY